jgi:hypothetical protein
MGVTIGVPVEVTYTVELPVQGLKQLALVIVLNVNCACKVAALIAPVINNVNFFIVVSFYI